MERKLRINELKIKVYFVVFKNEMEIVAISKLNTINPQNTSVTINLFISLNKVNTRYLKNFCSAILTIDHDHCYYENVNIYHLQHEILLGSRKPDEVHQKQV